mmetsp:Transcript_48331/g.161152  ORF Transcript_48331/g.161152 Transcript_48331/m.161152 type:complete len:252 (-) Transcript_48331:844-1599(-)
MRLVQQGKRSSAAWGLGANKTKICARLTVLSEQGERSTQQRVAPDGPPDQEVELVQQQPQRDRIVPPAVQGCRDAPVRAGRLEPLRCRDDDLLEREPAPAVAPLVCQQQPGARLQRHLQLADERVGARAARRESFGVQVEQKRGAGIVAKVLRLGRCPQPRVARRHKLRLQIGGDRGRPRIAGRVVEVIGALCLQLRQRAAPQPVLGDEDGTVRARSTPRSHQLLNQQQHRADLKILQPVPGHYRRAEDGR